MPYIVIKTIRMLILFILTQIRNHHSHCMDEETEAQHVKLRVAVVGIIESIFELCRLMPAFMQFASLM